MILYKGDRFVKGKTFLHESNVVMFVKKKKKGFVFEDVKSKKTVILDESDARTLKEVHKCRKAV